MDIAGLVNYESLYALNLKHPTTDEPLGIIFQIRSAGSEVAKEIQRKHTSKHYELMVKRKNLTGERAEEEELEKAASYIASWDWGENTYDGVRPQLTMKTAIAILEKEGWMFSAVVEAASKLENFSPDSPTT